MRILATPKIIKIDATGITVNKGVFWTQYSVNSM